MVNIPDAGTVCFEHSPEGSNLESETSFISLYNQDHDGCLLIV